jgi:hypothetical protein
MTQFNSSLPGLFASQGPPTEDGRDRRRGFSRRGVLVAPSYMWGPFRMTHRPKKPGEGHGWQITCPFHDRHAKTKCTRTAYVKGGDPKVDALVQLRLHFWAVRALLHVGTDVASRIAASPKLIHYGKDSVRVCFCFDLVRACTEPVVVRFVLWIGPMRHLWGRRAGGWRAGFVLHNMERVVRVCRGTGKNDGGRVRARASPHP